LLATPLRYDPKRGGSRFRAVRAGLCAEGFVVVPPQTHLPPPAGMSAGRQLSYAVPMKRLTFAIATRPLLLAAAALLIGCADQPARVISLGEQGALTVSIAAAADRALAGTLNHGAMLWDLDSGQLMANLSHDTDQPAVVMATALSVDGRFAVSAERNNLIRWDLASRQAAGHWGTTGVIRSVAIDGKGQRILAGLSTQSAWLIDASGTLSPTVIPHAMAVGVVALSADGRVGVTGSDDGMLRVWDLDSGTTLWRWSFDANVASLAISPDGQSLFAAPFHGTGKIWRLQDGHVLVERLGQPRGSMSSARFSDDSQQLLTGSPAGELILWSASTGERIQAWQAPRPTRTPPVAHALMDVAFVPGGQAVAAATSGGQVLTWPR